jgi:hypothetical protein
MEVNNVGAAIDLLPTLADMASVTLKAKKPLDGISLKTNLEGKQTSEDRLLFTAWNGKASVRSQTHRLQSNGKLFDLENDPREQNDVSKSQTEIAHQLSNALAVWKEENPLRRSNEELDRPITLGHPDAKWTQLPARDASFTGTITRSNRYPNCTFLQNWSDTDSKIIWDTEVLADGKFEVQLYYSCLEKDVGSTVELTIGNASISAKIVQPNESPLIGAEEDRFERMEGYVRRWEPMTLGTITLTKGHTRTILKAAKVAGDSVADMRLLMFRRVD